jgi:hypothetical protein
VASVAGDGREREVRVRGTRTVTAEAAGGGRGGADSLGTCSIASNAGNCCSTGQFCRNSDHGAGTATASGAAIECVYSSNAWRWSYA